MRQSSFVFWQAVEGKEEKKDPQVLSLYVSTLHIYFVFKFVQAVSHLAMGGNDHCCAVGCRSRQGMVDDEGTPLSFYTFPKDPDTRRLWVARVNRANLR